MYVGEHNLTGTKQSNHDYGDHQAFPDRPLRHHVRDEKQPDNKENAATQGFGYLNQRNIQGASRNEKDESCYGDDNTTDHHRDLSAQG